METGNISNDNQSSKPPKKKINSVLSFLFVILLMILIFLLDKYGSQENLPFKTVKNNVRSILRNLNNPAKKYPDAQIIKTNQSFFKTQSVPIRKRTQIKVKFIPPDFDTEIWLSLNMNDNKRKNLLVYNPTLLKLQWPHISNLSLTLFQKEYHYSNIEEFLKNPPKNAVIKADPNLIESGIISEDVAQEFDYNPNLNDIDYIITTYMPIYNEGSYSVYKTEIDATNAFVDEDNNLFWAIKLNNINEDNVFILKAVDINYSQPIIIEN